MRSRTPLTLEQALEHLASERFAGLDFDVDVKLPGYELRVVDALREAGLTARTLISGMYPSSLARVRAAEPSLRLGWSVPRVRRDYTSHLLTRSRPLDSHRLSETAATARRRGTAKRDGGRDHGSLAGRHRSAGERGRARGWRALCMDG